MLGRRMRHLLFMLLPLCLTVCLPGQEVSDVIPKSTVKELRDRKTANLPVVVRGIVTATDVVRIYLQDESGAIGIIRSGFSQPVKAGDVVEVTGTTTLQGQTVGLTGVSLKQIGTAPLPAAEPQATEKLDAAANHQRVRLKGIIHEVGVGSGMMILQVYSGRGSFMAMWPADPPAKDASIPKPRLDLLDAEVILEGAAAPLHTQSGVNAGFRLILPSPEPPHLQIVKRGSADPFTRPLKTVAELRSLKSQDNQRWRLRGVVTYWSDAQWFHFQDETGNARCNNSHFIPRGIGWPYRTERSEPALKPGDEIELVGMPVFIPTGQVSISRCEWRVVGHTEPPPFEPLSAKSVKGPDFEGRPASVTGRVVDMSVGRDYQGFAVHTLWMESDEVPFSAIVQKRTEGTLPVKAGDHVRLTGVLATSPGVVGRGVFRVNLNDFSAIHPIPPPPVWQDANLLRWLLSCIAVIGVAAVWIWLLRRQVAVQTTQLRENASRLEEQLEREKELGEMKSRFVFTVSHEFRNPLAAILSCSDVLQRLKTRISTEDYNRQIEGIRDNVRRMADMMEEVLLFGRAESGRLCCDPQPHDVGALLAVAVDHVRSAGNADTRVVLRVPDSIPSLLLDATLIRHIVDNLLGNAVKYSPADAGIIVEARHEKGVLGIRVRDHGAGIPPQDRKRIFEPFQRGTNVGHAAGSGLGLSIAQRCTSAHGGTITCEEVDGEGACFAVHIPCSPAP